MKKNRPLEVFKEYTSRYLEYGEKIRIKIEHTLAVVETMERLTSMLDISEHMKHLSYVTALFHDIGRFEQVKRYGTYLDSKSVDHALLGCEVIEEEDLLSFLEPSDRDMVVCAIRNHNRYAVEEGMEGDVLSLCHLIRDADKCDIFRVYATEDLKDIVGKSMEEVEYETVSDKVYEAVMNRRSVLKTDRKTGVDIWVGFLGFFYDMHFDETVKMLRDAGTYRKRFDEADFKLPETRKRVKEILDELEKYMEERI